MGHVIRVDFARMQVARSRKNTSYANHEPRRSQLKDAARCPVSRISPTLGSVDVLSLPPQRKGKSINVYSFGRLLNVPQVRVRRPAVHGN